MKEKAKAVVLPHGIYEKVAGSKIYWIRYADYEGRLRREKAGTLGNAKKLLSLRRGEKLAGKVHELRAPKAAPTPARIAPLTVGDLIKTAISSTESHLSAYDLHRKFQHIALAFGHRVAQEITKSDLIQWLDQMTKLKTWANASRNRYQAAISLLFRIAVEDRKLPHNPAKGIKHLREDNSRVRYLSLEEEEALLKELNEQRPAYTPIVVLAMHTGPRASELLRGQVGDYNPETGKLAIRQTKVRNSPFLRYVPLDPMAIAAYEALAKGKKIGDRLCTQPDRKTPVIETKYCFDDCVDAAKLVDFRFHDLRHTAASRWVMNGVPLAVVSRYLGHANIQMTMRYAHLSPDNDERAIAAMMSVYSTKPGPKIDTDAHNAAQP